MERLPNELLTEICSYLDNEDIFKLPFHIVSGALSRKDMKQRWRHMYVYLERSRLQGLVRLAAMPGLGEIVTKITITMQRPKWVTPVEFLRKAWSEHEMRRLQRTYQDAPVSTRNMPPDVTFDSFHRPLKQGESSCHYCHEMSLSAQYYQCINRYRAWKTWLVNKQDVSLLKTAFALLPNLKTVRFDDDVEVEKIWEFNDPPFFYTERYRSFAYTFSGSKFLERIVKAVSDSQVMVPSFRNMRNSRPSIYGSNVIYLMLGDLIVTVARNSFRPTFRNKLERLELTDAFFIQTGLFYRGTIGISSIAAPIPVIFHNSHLPYLVEAPKDLQILTIHSRIDRFSLNPCGPPLPAMYSPRFGVLSSLDLEGFRTQENRMECLLVNTKSTLKSLRLCNITMTRGTWVSLFDRIGGWFDLSDLKLDDLQNFGEELYEMTGEHEYIYLVMTHRAKANLFDWMCGLADVHYTRVLMSDNNTADREGDIRHRDSLLY